MNALIAVILAAGPAATPAPRDTCLQIRGIYEIRADASPVAPADAPRRPYLVLSDGPSAWVNADGLLMPMTWTCVPDELGFTLAGNTTVARWKDTHYLLNEKPLVRYVPRPENAARCETLAGQRWLIEGGLAGAQPALRGPKLGRGAFQSDLEETEAPSLTFAADGRTLDHYDGRIRREGVPYTCDAAGVRFATGNRLEVLTWRDGGLDWLDRIVRAPK